MRFSICAAILMLSSRLVAAPLPNTVAAKAPLALVGSHVAEKDNAGHPLFYYGKVLVHSRAQLGVLDLLRFAHSPQPFFDEFAPNATSSPKSTPGQTGRWEYAIAIGVQWNVLYQYPGLVDQIVLNPRNNLPHPQLDKALRSDGSLDPNLLADNGFRLPAPPPTHPDICAPDAVVTYGLLDDIGGFFAGIGEDVAGLFATVLKDFGGAISNVLVAAYDGVSEALTLLEQLGNDGVCALAGSRPNEGHVYVHDPNRPLDPMHPADSDLVMTFGPNVGKPEPLRNSKIHARGGPGGILLTSTQTNENGYYRFDNLCGDLDYMVSLDLEAPQVWISSDGYGSETVDLGYVGKHDTMTDWHTTDKNVNWLMGSQIASQFSQQFFHFDPGQAKLIEGWFPDTFVAPIDNNVSLTVCGEMNLLDSVVIAATLGLGSFIQPLFDGDIYGVSNSSTDKRAIGKAVHEYGHFIMCRAIPHFGGDLEAFLNTYLGHLIANSTDQAAAIEDPLRNTSESFADYVAFNAVGYTDYFNNDGGQWCAPDGSPTALCLEVDNAFLAPNSGTPPSEDDARLRIASRTSVMFDWTDTGFGPWGFSRRPPLTGPDDDALQLPTDTVARALGHIGTRLTTQNLSTWIENQSTFGKTAEGLCAIYKAHNWTCPDSVAGAIALDAPTDLDGRPVSTTDIVWSWVPRSSIATSTALLDGSGNTVLTVGADVSEAQASYAVGPNTLITAKVEAVRAGATPADSARVQRCTLTTPVTPTAAATASNIALTWSSDAATDYVVLRADGSGSLVQLGSVPTGAGNAFTDDTAVPGITYQYRVDGRNCDGVPTPGVAITATLTLSDSAMIFVRAGAVAGDGTRAHPLAWIANALPLVTAARNRVLVAEGTYPERLSISTASTVTLILSGGYDAAFTARDPKLHQTVITGDLSTWDTTFGSGEFAMTMHPIIAASGGPIVIDGLHVLPSWPDCASNKGCIPGSLLASTSPMVTLRNVEYRGKQRKNLDPQRYVASVFTYYQQLDVIDSTIVETGASGNIGIWAAQLNVTNSLVVAGGPGANTGIRADNPTIVRSVIRTDSSQWMPPVGCETQQSCTIGIDAAFVARISDSIIAGEIALRKEMVRDASHPALAPSVVVNSVLYGQTRVGFTQLADDILVSDHGAIVSHTDGALQLEGVDVRHNVFIKTSAMAHLVETAQRDNHGAGFLDDASALNNAVSWFYDSSNRVEGNFVKSIADVTGLTSEDPDLRAGAIEGHVFHPLPGVLYGQGASIAEYGYSGLDVDLDGVSHSSGFDIGPYASPPPGAPLCQHASCADLGAQCGAISDGCDVLLDCGACSGPAVCGATTPNHCG
jgi:hypothetical protein